MKQYGLMDGWNARRKFIELSDFTERTYLQGIILPKCDMALCVILNNGELRLILS